MKRQDYPSFWMKLSFSPQNPCLLCLALSTRRCQVHINSISNRETYLLLCLLFVKSTDDVAVMSTSVVFVYSAFSLT